MNNPMKKEAPELIPRIDGPASGLPKSVCIIKPETANEAPAIKAIISLGILNSQIKIWEVSFLE